MTSRRTMAENGRKCGGLLSPKMTFRGLIYNASVNFFSGDGMAGRWRKCDTRRRMDLANARGNRFHHEMCRRKRVAKFARAASNWMRST